MSRGTVPFRQADVTRACKGVLAAGLTPSRAEIGTDGKIIMVFGEAASAAPESPYDKWKAEENAKAGK